MPDSWKTLLADHRSTPSVSRPTRTELNQPPGPTRLVSREGATTLPAMTGTGFSGELELGLGGCLSCRGHRSLGGHGS